MRKRLIRVVTVSLNVVANENVSFDNLDCAINRVLTPGVALWWQLGYEAVMRLTRSVKLGATIGCVVTDADPRRDVLRLQEALYFQANSKAKETAKAQAEAANVARAETSSKLPSSEVVGVEVSVG